MSQVEHSEDALARRLGGAASVAIVAGSMLGVGIFLNPRIVAEQFTSPFGFMAMWLLGGLIALSGAAAYAQLGAMFPRAGGDYVYLREAFGRAVSAAGGWILVVAVFPGSVATMAVALGEYQLPVLLAGAGYDPHAPIVGGLSLAGVSALCILGLLTAVNALGAHLSGRAQVWMTAVPVAVFGAVAVWALLTGAGPTPVAPVAPVASDASWFERFTIAYMAVYFAYSGWNAVGYVGGEVGNPRRNIPLGLLGGTVLVTGLYMVLCAAFVAVLGMDGLTHAFEAGSVTASALFGERAVVPIAVLIAFAIIGSINATILGGARITFAMGWDGTLPQGFGTVWKKTRTPLRALALQAGISALLIVSGTFEQLLAMTSLSMLVLGILTVSALFVLRARRPELAAEAPRFGYPLLPAVYLFFALGVVGFSVKSGLEGLRGPSGDLDQEFLFSLGGLVVFAAVVAVYGLRELRSTRGVGG